MDQAGQGATLAAPLVVLAPGRLEDEVQCPDCGWCTRWVEVTDDEPTIPGPTCPHCGGMWQVRSDGPAPDTVVDSTRPNISRVAADRNDVDSGDR